MKNRVAYKIKKCSRGLTRDPSTGRKIVAVAVFEVISVKNVIIVDITTTIATLGILFSPVSCWLSAFDSPDF